MIGFIPKENLTAYQRWELAAFDEAEQAAARAAKAKPPPPETPTVLEPEESRLALPTASEIERMHIEAHEQGYAAGYAEGIAAAQANAEKIGAVMTHLEQALREVDQNIADLDNAVAIRQEQVNKAIVDYQNAIAADEHGAYFAGGRPEVGGNRFVGAGVNYERGVEPVTEPNYVYSSQGCNYRMPPGMYCRPMIEAPRTLISKRSSA